jgi:hypothetical protein
MTAMILQALAPYKNVPKVKAAIDAALDMIKSRQSTLTGGLFSNAAQTSYDSETQAQVLVALTALGINPAGADWTANNNGTPLTALLSFYDADSKSFKHTIDAPQANVMSTEQAAYALAAVKRYTDNAKPLYDMSDDNGWSFVIVSAEDNEPVQKGVSKTFTATAAGRSGANGAIPVTGAVAWEVSNNSSTGTNISSDGVLTVAADETASFISVKAASGIKNDAMIVELVNGSGNTGVTVTTDGASATAVITEAAIDTGGETISIDATSGNSGVNSVTVTLNNAALTAADAADKALEIVTDIVTVEFGATALDTLKGKVGNGSLDIKIEKKQSGGTHGGKVIDVSAVRSGETTALFTASDAGYAWITIPYTLTGGNTAAVWYGGKQLPSSWVTHNGAANTVTFRTSHFSEFEIGETAPGTTCYVGDANGDGKVNNYDAVLVLRAVAGQTDEVYNVNAADADGDGKVDDSDAVLILCYIAALEAAIDGAAPPKS